MQKFRFNILFATCGVALFALASWLVMADSSPLHEYFLYHVTLPNLWSLVHIIPVIIGSLVTGNVHQGSEFVTFVASAVQWFILGFALSLLFKRPGHRHHGTV